jgi:hypothetical protein
VGCGWGLRNFSPPRPSSSSHLGPVWQGSTSGSETACSGALPNGCFALGSSFRTPENALSGALWGRRSRKTWLCPDPWSFSMSLTPFAPRAQHLLAPSCGGGAGAGGSSWWRPAVGGAGGRRRWRGRSHGCRGWGSLRRWPAGGGTDGRRHEGRRGGAGRRQRRWGGGANG